MLRVFDLGVQAVVVNTNQLNRPEEDEQAFIHKIEVLLDHTKEIPLGLYECPRPYKRLLSPSLMRWLASTNRFVYLKDTSCNIDSIKLKIEAVENSNLGFYNANTPTALESLAANGKGLSPIAANFYPELFTYLIDHWDDNRRENDVMKLKDFLCVAECLVASFYPLSSKIFLKNRGIRIGATTTKRGTKFID